MMREFVFLCIEDDQSFSQLLKERVMTYFQLYDICIQFQIYHSIPQNIQYNDYDACFLDIEIDQDNSLTVMQNIRNQGINIPIIVISHYEYYIFDSVKFHIFDFIRKSHFDKEINMTLEKLKEHLKQINNHICIHYLQQYYKIYIKDILYILTQSHHIIIYQRNQKPIEIWQGYHDIFIDSYPQLIRIHKSYIVNIDNCQYIDKRVVSLVNDEKLPVSQRCYKEFIQMFLKKHSLR